VAPHQHQQLVFVQNGLLLPWLAKHGLQYNTQVLLYMSGELQLIPAGHHSTCSCSFPSNLLELHAIDDRAAKADGADVLDIPASGSTCDTDTTSCLVPMLLLGKTSWLRGWHIAACAAKFVVLQTDKPALVTQACITTSALAPILLACLCLQPQKTAE
jgi:hypothetical protein